MIIAKSGRRYHKIPEGYDIEEWDEMTPIQRLKALGLIETTVSNWEKYDDDVDDVDDTRLGLDGEETWNF